MVNTATCKRDKFEKEKKERATRLFLVTTATVQCKCGYCKVKLYCKIIHSALNKSYLKMLIFKKVNIPDKSSTIVLN